MSKNIEIKITTINALGDDAYVIRSVLNNRMFFHKTGETSAGKIVFVAKKGLDGAAYFKETEANEFVKQANNILDKKKYPNGIAMAVKLKEVAEPDGSLN